MNDQRPVLLELCARACHTAEPADFALFWKVAREVQDTFGITRYAEPPEEVAQQWKAIEAGNPPDDPHVGVVLVQCMRSIMRSHGGIKSTYDKDTDGFRCLVNLRGWATMLLGVGPEKSG